MFPKGTRGFKSPSRRLYSKPESKKHKKNDLKSINTKDFEKFLRVQLSLADLTVKQHMSHVEVFLRQVGKLGRRLSAEDVQDFMLWLKNNKSSKTYGNYLCTLKVRFRDFLKEPEIINDFKFPTIAVKPKILPFKGGTESLL